MLHIRLNDRTLLRLHTRDAIFLLHLILLSSHDLRKRVRFLFLRLRLNLLDFHLLLDDGHIFLRFSQFNQPVFVSFDVSEQIGTFFRQHVGEKINELEERLGRRAGVPSFLFHEFDTELVDEIEGVGHEFDDGLADGFVAEFDGFEELFGDTVEGLVGPGEEPIDDRAVHERGELSGTTAHVSFGGETETHVEVFLNRVHEPGPAVFSTIGLAFAFDFSADVIYHRLLLVQGIQVSDFPG